MKAAAIILMSIGLVVLIKDAEAGNLTSDQIKKLDTFFRIMHKVIELKELGAFLKGESFLEGNNSAITNLVSELDIDDDGFISFLELLRNQAIVQCINNKKKVLQFFADMCGIAKKDLKEILVTAKACTAGGEDSVLANMDHSGGGVVNFTEFMSNDIVAGNVANYW